MKAILEEVIKTDSKRLLTMLDRNSFGQSQGLFDRYYWHFKTTDFPSAIMQMGMGILAKLYLHDEKFKNQITLRWIEQAIAATLNIQHSDGTFDEWYPNERGWAGPTAYLLNAFCDTYLAVGSELDEQSRENLFKLISRSASALTKSGEGHVLTNHLAIAWLGLVQSRFVLKSSAFDSKIQSLKDQILANFNEDEGWSLEYDGADPGYQTGTLSFLSKGFKFDRDLDLVRCAEKSLEFIAHFAYPDGTFGGAVGSRHTVNAFVAGLVAWRSHPIGMALCTHFEEAMKNGRICLPSDIDDHYYFYRLSEFLDAYEFVLETEPHPQPSQLPFQNAHKKLFAKAGIRTQREGDVYSVVSLARGGVLMAWDCRQQKKIAQDNGVVVSFKGQDLSSLWQGSYQSTIKDSSVEIVGPLYPVTPKHFSPLRQILFRLVSLVFGNHSASAKILKDSIRTMLIMNRPSKANSFVRKIEFSESGITVKTEVSLKKNPKRMAFGGEFWTRYVPQSRNYIAPDDWKGYEPTFTGAGQQDFSHIKHYGVQ